MTFTQAELEEGFNLVQPKTHWKDRIHTSIKEDEIPLVTEAIIHFTGSVPTFQHKRILSKNRPYREGERRFFKGDTIVDVYAEGYLATIGA
jgi:hypothetical protein